MFLGEYGVDLGTSTLSLACGEKGPARREPNLLVLDRRRGGVRAVGGEALAMLDRTPGGLRTCRPVERGLVSRPDEAAAVLRLLLKKAGGRGGAKRMCLGAPAGATSMERDTLTDVALHAGARHVMLIERPLAAALGAGLDVFIPQGKMVADIGAGTTDIAVMSMGGVVFAMTAPVGGDDFDREICRVLRERFSLVIGPRTAEAVKLTVACCTGEAAERSMPVKGKHAQTGLPVVCSVASRDLRAAMDALAQRIAQQANQVLERTPPELVGDVHTGGILLTGGAAALPGLAEYLSRALKTEVRAALNAPDCVAAGAARALAVGRSLENGVFFPTR